jgi:hypothetical protein
LDYRNPCFFTHPFIISQKIELSIKKEDRIALMSENEVYESRIQFLKRDLYHSELEISRLYNTKEISEREISDLKSQIIALEIKIHNLEKIAECRLLFITFREDQISEELSKLHEEIFRLKNRISDLIMISSSNIPGLRGTPPIPLTRDSSSSSSSSSFSSSRQSDHNHPLLSNIASGSSGVSGIQDHTYEIDECEKINYHATIWVNRLKRVGRIADNEINLRRVRDWLKNLEDNLYKLKEQ